MLQLRGDLDESAALCEQAVAVFREFGDRLKEGGTLLNLTLLARVRGDLASARDLGRQAVALLGDAPDKRSQDRARDVLAALAGQPGV
jgi:hypothetical protein